MAVLKNPYISTLSRHLLSRPAASRIAFGAAVVGSALTEGAETLKPAISENTILGFAARRAFNRSQGYDGFYEANEELDVIGDYAIALVTPNGADVNIDMEDYLEVAALGNGSTSAHGILEEAGSGAGTVFTVNVVAKAMESVAMGIKSYKVPASNVAVGATSITMTSGDPATMGLTVGDLILLEDLNGACQVNKVASVADTSIGLVIPSTVALTTADSDLVTRLYQVLVKVVK
jgi:hypothetical protein